ncbi:glycosyltransferase family 4 protein [Wenyingzhuangia sp. IMCC45533]
MQTLLIIGYVWPEPTATAAGSRMLQIIEQFSLSHYKVVFASPAQRVETSFDLEILGIQTVSIALNNSSFDEFLEELSPSIVLFDRFMMEEQFGWRVAKICPNAIKMLDSEDLHFLRKARQQAVKNNLALPVEMIASEDAKREIASIYRCDATLTISEFEMKYLLNEYKIPSYLLWYFPFIVNVKEEEFPKFSERNNFMFIGNFVHAPNWDAVLELKKNIWPLLKKQLPNANLNIYGGYPSQKVFQLNNAKEGFHVVGRAEEVSKIMQKAKVCLAPLRFGAGLKGKLLDAMQNNTPFVTSEIGAEGMFGNIDMIQSVANSTDDFIKKSIALYTDEVLWNRMAAKGRQVLKNRFDKASYRAVFTQNLASLMNNYQKNRSKNFVGSMLQHHTLKSTMYMSKWIEEKNKH